jgi:hypothetical protein
MSAPPASQRLSPLTEKLLCGVLLAVALLQFAWYFVYRPLAMHGVDFTVLWRASRQVLLGASAYSQPAVLIGPGGWEVFKYPQFLALATAWLGALPFYTAETVWKLFLLGCCALVGWSSVRLACTHAHGGEGPGLPWMTPRLAAVGMLLALSMFSSFAWSLELGQVGPILALLLLWAYLECRRQRDLWAGSALALAMLIKLVPALIIVQGAIHRRWKAVLGALAIAAAYLMGLAAFGLLRDEFRYFTLIVPSIPRLTTIVSHSLIQWLVARCAPATLADPQRHAAAITATQAVFLVIYFVPLVIAAWRGRTWASCFPVALVGLPLVSPVLEGHHFVILWAAWVAHYTLFIEGRMSARLAALLLLCWLPIFLVTTFHQLMTDAPLHFVPTFANVAVWILSIVAAQRTDELTHRKSAPEGFQPH